MKLKLATLRDGTRDGALVVSSQNDGDRFFRCAEQYATLLDTVEDWDRFAADLVSGAAVVGPALATTDMLCIGPALPRTWQVLYGSAFGNRMVRVSQTARSNADAYDEAAAGVPLMYQGASDRFLGPGEAINACGEDAELDLEPEIAVITNNVPQGTTAAEAHRHVLLVVLLNDFTYRTFVKRERKTGFGFIQSKPVSGMAPFACTPAALNECWRDGVLQATVVVVRNGELVGRIATHEMQYTFYDLIQHAAATRSLTAGTIISSGTVNSSVAEGAASLIEMRALQQMRGEALSPFLQNGDEVVIDVVDDRQRSLFGRLNNRVLGNIRSECPSEIETSRISA
jgi:fumarylacetoacetate (FAA) hydrolase